MYNEINKWFRKIADGSFDKTLNLSDGNREVIAYILYIFKKGDTYINVTRSLKSVVDMNKYKDMILINKFYITFYHNDFWPFNDEDEIDDICTIYNIGDFSFSKHNDLGNFENYIKDYDYKKVPFTDEEYLNKNTFYDEGKIHELPIR